MRIRSVLILALFTAWGNLSANEFTVSGGSGDVGKSKSAYSSATVNQPYPLGWWARTSTDALRVLFSPGNEFRLLPRSEVQISGEGAAGGRFRRVLKLNNGSVDLDLQKLEGSKVDVETPTAICGAVGTRFTVNAATGRFEVAEGRIYANAKGDDSFSASSVSGSFALLPGRDNAYAEAAVSGSFKVNGRPFQASGVRLAVAKGKGGGGPAAVRVTGGVLGSAGSGSFLMEGGSLTPVPADLAPVHGSYLAAADREGGLNVTKQTTLASGRPVPATLESDLAAAAREANALRQKLFARRVIREAAQDAARDATRSNARPSMGH